MKLFNKTEPKKLPEPELKRILIENLKFAPCRVEGKDRAAVELVSLFKKYRFNYNKSSGTKGDNLIGAVSKFVEMQETYGSRMVETVLRVIRNAWYGDKNSLSSAIITGLATFLAENDSVDEMMLVKALEKVIPSMLIAQANAYVKCDMLRPGRADSACYHIAKMIAQCYETEVNKPQRGRKAKVS